MKDFTIHVNTDVLRIKADDVQNRILAMRNEISDIKNIMSGFKYHWGETAREVYMDELNDYLDSTETVLLRLSEHPDDLKRMAGIYDEAEKQNTETPVGPALISVRINPEFLRMLKSEDTSADLGANVIV